MVQHNDCLTKEENGCFYFCCDTCEFYRTKRKDGKIEIWEWDSSKQNHVSLGVD